MGGTAKLENNKKTFRGYFEFLRSYIEFYKKANKKPREQLTKLMDDYVDTQKKYIKYGVGEETDAMKTASSCLDRMWEYSERALPFACIFATLNQLIDAKTAEQVHKLKADIMDTLKLDRNNDTIPSLEVFIKSWATKHPYYGKRPTFLEDWEGYEKSIALVEQKLKELENK